MNAKSLGIPPFLVISLLLMNLFVLFSSSDALLWFEATLVFLFIYKVTWRKDEPPIVFFALISQYIQVIAILLRGLLNGTSIAEVTDFPYEIYSAFHLGLYSIAFLALGYALVMVNFRYEYSFKLFLDDISKYNNIKLLAVYSLLIVFMPAMQSIATSLGALRQPIYKLLEIKWSLLFILFYSSFVLRSNFWIFFFIMIFEILMSFTGYFSNFKEIILVVVICYLTYLYRLDIVQYFWIVIVLVFLLGTSLIWQFTKTDYRTFLSNESAEQVSTVSRTEALSKFKDLLIGFEASNLEAASQQLLDRVSYINFFSAAISNVPSQIKHENGKLLADALTRSFTPRFLFPNKSMIDDSENTTKYTGIKVLGIDSGTSISMGYVTETYIDFGYPLMFLATFGIGVLIGLIYRVFLKYAINKVWAYAYLLPFTLNIYSFETALAKFIPAIIFYVIIVLVFNRLLATKIDEYLRSH